MGAMRPIHKVGVNLKYRVHHRQILTSQGRLNKLGRHDVEISDPRDHLTKILALSQKCLFLPSTHQRKYASPIEVLALRQYSTCHKSSILGRPMATPFWGKSMRLVLKTEDFNEQSINIGTSRF